MTHNWLRYLVPREWTGDHALLAVNLLKQAHSAIWEVHGEAMAVALGAERYRDRLDDYVEIDEKGPFEDDIPF